MPYYTYIMASRPGGALYIGSTHDLRGQVDRHKFKAFPCHTEKYNITKLVWFETHETRQAARRRAARIKRWRRAWKIDLILTMNPVWQDISPLSPAAAPRRDQGNDAPQDPSATVPGLPRDLHGETSTPASGLAEPH